MPANPIDLTTVATVQEYLSTNNAPSATSGLIQSLVTSASMYWQNRTGRNLAGIQSYSERYDGSGSYRQFVRNPPILSVSLLNISGTAIQQSLDYASPGFVIDQSRKSLSLIGGAIGMAALQPGMTSGYFGTATFTYGSSLGYAQIANNFCEGIQNVLINYVSGYTFPVIAEQQVVASGSVTLNFGKWYSDQGVTDANGNALTLVTGAPAAGQYAVSALGVYTFNSAANGSTVYISYTYSGVPADVQDKVCQMVAVNFKRRGWIDQAQQQVSETGTISYRSWAVPPEVEQTIQAYKRGALV